MATTQNSFETHLSYVLAAAHRSVSSSLSDRLKKHSIKIEAWRVLECLDSGLRLTMGDLAKRALINPPTLSKLVDRMVSDGLVHRQVGAEDQRQINLLLTDLGRVRMVQIRKDVEEQDQVLINQLNEDEGVLLLNLLARIG